MGDGAAESLMLEPMAMEVEDVARPLVESIGDDGQPTPKTIELSREAVLQILDAATTRGA